MGIGTVDQRTFVLIMSLSEWPAVVCMAARGALGVIIVTVHAFSCSKPWLHSTHMQCVVKDLRLEDKDLWSEDKDLQIGPRGQGLTSRTVNKTGLQ